MLKDQFDGAPAPASPGLSTILRQVPARCPGGTLSVRRRHVKPLGGPRRKRPRIDQTGWH